MLFSGRPLLALLCLILQVTVIGWIPAAIWSCMIVSSHKADKRAERIIRETRRRG